MDRIWRDRASAGSARSDYTYVREDVWEALAAGARAAQDDDLLDRIADWRNPSQMRPASLLRNR